MAASISDRCAHRGGGLGLTVPALSGSSLFAFDRQQSLSTAPTCTPPLQQHRSITHIVWSIDSTPLRSTHSSATAVRSRRHCHCRCRRSPSFPVAMMKGLEDDEGPETSLRKLTQTFGVLGYVVLNKSGEKRRNSGGGEAEAAAAAGRSDCTQPSNAQPEWVTLCFCEPTLNNDSVAPCHCTMCVGRRCCRLCRVCRRRLLLLLCCLRFAPQAFP